MLDMCVYMCTCMCTCAHACECSCTCMSMHMEACSWLQLCSKTFLLYLLKQGLWMNPELSDSGYSSWLECLRIPRHCLWSAGITGVSGLSWVLGSNFRSSCFGGKDFIHGVISPDWHFDIWHSKFFFLSLCCSLCDKFWVPLFPLQLLVECSRRRGVRSIYKWALTVCCCEGDV